MLANAYLSLDNLPKCSVLMACVLTSLSDSVAFVDWPSVDNELGRGGISRKRAKENELERTEPQVSCEADIYPLPMPTSHTVPAIYCPSFIGLLERRDSQWWASTMPTALSCSSILGDEGSCNWYVMIPLTLSSPPHSMQ